jgi:predicted signal transduction protein with EAL and GGDEF domain
MMIEITESAFMNAPIRNEPVLAEIHGRGLRLAIDDFGTGYSSLSRLNHMPATTLKIDRSFVADLTRENAGGLVSAMIRMAEATGLQQPDDGDQREEHRGAEDGAGDRSDPLVRGRRSARDGRAADELDDDKEAQGDDQPVDPVE